MYSKHLALKVLCLGVLWAACLPSASADVWNKKTEVTFSGPVEIPGAVLEPGKYVMKLVDSPSNRHIVQVMNADENHVYATILAIPNYRLEPSGNTVISFYEMPAGQPQALKAWFYPGDNFGQEFAYPKTRATQISQVTSQNVPAVPADMEPKLAQASPPATEPPLQDSSAANEESNAAAPSVAENAEPPAPPSGAAQESAAKPEQGTRKMPGTASELPLVGLCGLLALGGAITLRLRQTGRLSEASCAAAGNI
jgi:hypothetical protein